jgi:hypothetical protein
VGRGLGVGKPRHGQPGPKLLRPGPHFLAQWAGLGRRLMARMHTRTGPRLKVWTNLGRLDPTARPKLAHSGRAWAGISGPTVGPGRAWATVFYFGLFLGPA